MLNIDKSSRLRGEMCVQRNRQSLLVWESKEERKLEKIGFPDGLISSSPVPQMAIDPSLMRKDFHQKKKNPPED